MPVLPLLFLATWGIAIAMAFVFLIFLFIAYVVIQETRAQLHWRGLVEQGDVDAIRTLVSEELTSWKTMRAPKDVPQSLWHGVQSAELLEVKPDAVRISASAEGQYALVSGERREVSSALKEGMRLTVKVADMALYDIPNVKLPYVQVDIYSTFRDEEGASQQCILSTIATRELGDQIDWDSLDAEEIVRAFGGRFALDDRGNGIPIDPDAPRTNGVPAVFYKDE
jgi:hypothetical protein